MARSHVVIGNPPFLGGKMMRTVLGNDYVDRLFATYAGRVPAEADLVTYWFAKAWERLPPVMSNVPGWSQPTRSAVGQIVVSSTPSLVMASCTTHGMTSHGFSMARQCGCH
jgi:hypothetical protein